MCSPLRAKSLAKMSPGVATPCPAAPPIATAKVRSIAGLLVKEKKGGGLVTLEAAGSGITGRHWTRFIDCEGPAFEVLAVHFGNSLITAVLHFYETKTFGASGVAIGDDADRFNRARLAEQFLEITLRRFKRQISYIQLLFHGITPLISNELLEIASNAEC